MSAADAASSSYEVPVLWLFIANSLAALAMLALCTRIFNSRWTGASNGRQGTPGTAGASASALARAREAKLAKATNSTEAVASESKDGHAWWHSPLADAEEARIIERAMTLVKADGLAPLPPHADLELLRQLRALGRTATPDTLASTYAKHLRWRRENVLRPAGSLDPATRQIWYPPVEHARGEWARTRVELGLCIGRATGGHPVKFERVGKADIARMVREAGGPEALLNYYYSILDTMLIALNAESAKCGRLLRTYEVFDLKGLSIFKCSVTAISTVTKLVMVVIGPYAETTSKAVLFNLPRTVVVPVRGILSLLPERVAARVTVLGEGESFDFLNDELDAQAMRMLSASGEELAHHCGASLAGVAPPEGSWPGRAWREERKRAAGNTAAASQASSANEDDQILSVECMGLVRALSENVVESP